MNSILPPRCPFCKSFSESAACCDAAWRAHTVRLKKYMVVPEYKKPKLKVIKGGELILNPGMMAPKLRLIKGGIR